MAWGSPLLGPWLAAMIGWRLVEMPNGILNLGENCRGNCAADGADIIDVDSLYPPHVNDGLVFELGKRVPGNCRRQFNFPLWVDGTLS
jgi:hypothetical protein